MFLESQDSDYLVENITHLITADLEVFLHSVLMSTQPNSLPTT